MNSKWFLQVRYFLSWILLFIGAKLLFLTYHAPRTENLSGAEICKIVLYGLRMDFSITAYLSIIPFFLFGVQALFPRLSLYRVVTLYSGFFLVLVSFLTVVDLELFNAWGFRLDATPLQYVSTPAEMLASVSSAPLLWLFLLFGGFTLGGFFLFYKLVFSFKPVIQKNTLYIITSFWYFILLIIPARGGLQHFPINHSTVYFSDKLFLNQAVVNVPWNIMYSISTLNYRGKNPYVYLPDSTARRLVINLYKPVPETTIPTILKNPRPNILLIILESFTAKLVGGLGGEPNVAPNLNQLAQEGLLFNNIYASADRSEKGLVSLLSSYPAQPFMSVIKTPHKTQTLPHLNQILGREGYHSSFYYGGELAFANIKSYLVNAGYDQLISKFDFDAKDYNSKWGVHDHVLFDRVLRDLPQEKQPFFSTVFTLSSHEPYDIPFPAKFKGTDEATLFKNSAYYTDYALGKFITEAKKEPWWQNTLVILVADHGHRFPGNDPIDAPSKFHIPLILTGGALAVQSQVVSKLGSHTDIVPTLLTQMNLPTHQFAWSKNLLNPAERDFAFYVFQDGFGFITPRGTFTIDNISQKKIRQDPGVPPAQVNTGKAYMQYSFQDFQER